MTNWVFEKRIDLEEPRGPKGGKRNRNYPIFLGSRAEWEARQNRKAELFNKTGQRYSFDELLEIFPDQEHRTKWRNLPPPPGGTRHGRPPEFWRAVTWHTRCLPVLEVFRRLLSGHLNEPIPVGELVERYQQLKPNYSRRYIVGTLNQLWKGGKIRKFVRYSRWGIRSDGSKKPGDRGRYFGVHYAFYSYSEEDIREG